MFTEIINRFKAPTPVFFKKVQILGVSIVAFGTGITQMPNVSVPLVSIATHAIVAGGIMVLIAKLAIQNVGDETANSQLKSTENV